MAKKYFWLKLKEDFFRDKRIKKMRKVAGGDTYTLIYLKMQLLSLKNEGILLYEGVEDDFAEEIALEIDEDADNVRFTIMFLEKNGLLEEMKDNEFALLETMQSIGSETQGADRVRKHRELKKNNQLALQCNTSETKCNTEIEKEIEIEKENIKETSAKPPSASKVKYEESNPYYQLANYLYQSILRNDPKAKQPNMQTWSDEIRKLVELDERDILEIKDIVTFATNHHFWKKNILSTKKLREKFSTLYIEYNEPPKTYGQKKYQAPQQQAPSKVEFVKLEPDNNGFDGTNLSYEFMNRGIDNDTLIAYYKKQVEITGKGVFDGNREVPLEEWIGDFQAFNK